MREQYLMIEQVIEILKLHVPHGTVIRATWTELPLNFAMSEHTLQLQFIKRSDYESHPAPGAGQAAD